MAQWQNTPRQPPKTKAELREMLTEAVRNTQSEPKRRPKAKKDRDQASRMKGTCEVPKMPFW
jgi:hypothetical protein